LGFFKGYNDDQRQREGAILKRGISFFEDLLKFYTSKIMQEIEEEISAVQGA